jgi:hypothetical protein
MSERDNSAVIERASLDAEHAAKFEKPWIFDADGRQSQHDTEEEACAAQRYYRATLGFDPVTGERPKAISEEAFDQATDDATHDVIAAYEKHGAKLPTGEALSTLMVQINDAITPIMRDAIERENGLEG